MIALFSTQNTIVVYNAKNVKLNSTFNTISLVGGIIGLIAIGIIQNRLDTGFLIIGSAFTYSAIQFYSEVGRLNTNLTIIAAGTILIGIVLIITTVLLFSLVSVVREKN